MLRSAEKSSPPRGVIPDDGEDFSESSALRRPNEVPETTPCNDVPVLRRAAMDYLARREHSFYELSQKLQKKFPDTDTQLLFEVVDALRGEKLQCDDRFAESYARYRISRGFAYLHIKADLSTRRVSESLIDKHLAADDERWQLMANELTVKKLRGETSLAYGSKTHRKQLRFLESRGFSPLQCKKALEPYLD